MIETIRIFDEYSESPQNLSPEDRHKKRMNLEILIYDILKTKYGMIFSDFWKTHEVPTQTNKTIVLVERRIHPNLAFVLYNAAYFCRDWGITILCSDVNYEYCKAICGKNLERVTLFPIFKGNPTPELAKKEYNQLLQNPDLYRSFQTENLLFLETDCYLRRPVPLEILQYDYVAAPYNWDNSMAGGGMSFRKRTPMIHVCESLKDHLAAQDVYVCKGVLELGYRMPEFEKGVSFITESVFSTNPFGVHQWWTFFFPRDIPNAKAIFHAMMKIHV